MSNTTLLRDISRPTGTPMTMAPTNPIRMRKQLMPMSALSDCPP